MLHCKGLPLKALILVSAWCGLRWGEVTELRPQDDRLPSLRDLIEVSFQGLDGAAV